MKALRKIGNNPSSKPSITFGTGVYVAVKSVGRE